MKRKVALLSLLTILSCVAGPLDAGQMVPAKNCTWCHGTSAEGYSNAPRLAGQQQLYLAKQLKDFREHVRDNPYSRDFMWNAVARIDPDLADAFAAYFATLPAEPANDGHRELVANGRAIYQLGIPEADIAACVVCHGPNGEGARDIPRLQGLSYFYLKRRLDEWNQGFDSAASPMPKVARSLTRDQIDALASYLSFADIKGDR